MREHREGIADGFTKKHRVDRLVYFETLGEIDDAIRRETRLKKWKRQRKIDPIRSANVEWRDLYQAGNP
jgi:putative endonuclease